MSNQEREHVENKEQVGESGGQRDLTLRDQKYEEFWRSLSRAGDPARIPNKVRTGYNEGWKDAREITKHAPRPHKLSDEELCRMREQFECGNLGFSKIVAAIRAEVDDCPDCVAAKKHSYSDATTPGFFFDKCVKHRERVTRGDLIGAAEKVNAFVETIESAASQPERAWISVEERLPEMFDSLPDEGIHWSKAVLVADGPALDLAAYHTGKHGNKWIAESGSAMEVDHWMPLPDPPVEHERGKK